MNDLLRAIERDDVLFDREYQNELIEGLDFCKLEMESVGFTGCRLVNCDLSGCVFKQVSFDNCNLSSCRWKGAYFRDVKLMECKGDGGDYSRSSLINTTIRGGSWHYGNFSMTLWDNCIIQDTQMGDSFFSEVKFKKTRFDNVNLVRGDFFKTMLKGIDLSTCLIDGITLSDTFREIKDVRLCADQAVVIAQMLGVKII